MLPESHILPTPPARAAASSRRDHVWRTVTLALPVIAARSGVLIMAAVDSAMTGRYDAGELAFIGLGIPPTIVLMLLGIGMLLGTTILTAQADGAGSRAECGPILRASLRQAVVFGALAWLLCLFGEPFLLAIGQDPGLAEGGGRVIAAFGWAMPAILVSISITFFLEGISRPVPGMVIMIAANIVNFGLNLVFIDGGLGVPAMGAEGAMLATSLTRWLGLLAFFIYLWRMPGRSSYGLGSARPPPPGVGRKLLRLGWPIALAQGLESTAFAAMSLAAGYLGAVPVAGYQIAINLVALTFMSAIGIATATGVRVSNAVGRRDPTGLRIAGWTGIGLAIMVMGGFSLLVIFAGEPLARLFTTANDVVQVAVAALFVAGFMMIFDGMQVVFVQALRSVGDLWVPLILQSISFWLIAVPLGAVLAFELGLGAAGLMGGLFAGVVVSAAGNGWRFAAVSRRGLARL